MLVFLKDMLAAKGPWLSWESAAFATRRSRVRSPSGPPNVYWTNTYFFSGGFAVKVML